MFFIYVLTLIIPVAFYTLAEKKIIAAIQRRTGPNVVGFFWSFTTFCRCFKGYSKRTN